MDSPRRRDDVRLVRGAGRAGASEGPGGRGRVRQPGGADGERGVPARGRLRGGPAGRRRGGGVFGPGSVAGGGPGRPAGADAAGGGARPPVAVARRGRPRHPPARAFPLGNVRGARQPAVFSLQHGAAAVPPRHADPVLRRRALLPRRVGRRPARFHRHEHPGRAGHLGGVPLQRGRRLLPFPGHRRGARRPPVLRDVRGDHRPRPAGPLLRVPGAGEDVRGGEETDRPGAEDRPGRARRGRGGRPSRVGRRRGARGGPAGGEGAGRRDGRGGPLRGRRVDAHRGADPGREGAGQRGDGRDDEPRRAAPLHGDPRGEGHRPLADRRDRAGGAGEQAADRAARGRDRVVLRPRGDGGGGSSRSSRGTSSDRSREGRTRWST